MCIIIPIIFVSTIYEGAVIICADHTASDRCAPVLPVAKALADIGGQRIAYQGTITVSHVALEGLMHMLCFYWSYLASEPISTAGADGCMHAFYHCWSPMKILFLYSKNHDNIASLLTISNFSFVVSQTDMIDFNLRISRLVPESTAMPRVDSL